MDTTTARKLSIRPEAILVILAFMFLSGTVVYAIVKVTAWQTENLEKDRDAHIRMREKADQDRQKVVVANQMKVIATMTQVKDSNVALAKAFNAFDVEQRARERRYKKLEAHVVAVIGAIPSSKDH